MVAVHPTKVKEMLISQHRLNGRLANGGEKLILEDANSKILVSFEYDDKGAWPSQADGNGSSLELINPLSSASGPSNWKSSLRPGGTPGD